MKAIKVNVVPDLDPKWGGTSVAVPALCGAMHARDDSVRLYFAGDGTARRWPDFCEPFPKSTPCWFHRSHRLRRALREGVFDVIHHHAVWLPSLGSAHRGAQRSGCPLVISPHGMLSRYALSRARVKKWLARRFLHPGAMKGASAWHATSEGEFKEIRAAGFAQPVVVLPNGVDVPEWNGEGDRGRWLERCPELEGKRILLFYSRLHSKKGVLPLLAAWSRLAQRHRDWRLLLSGTPHEYDLDEVRAYARSLGISERVTIADPEGLAKPYPLAELFVLPTRSENFGLVIAEALSAGVAVLTTTEAPWEKMNALGCGACVPWPRFEDALNRLLCHDAETLGRMGDAGRAWTRSTFSWDRIAGEMLEFYRSL